MCFGPDGHRRVAPRRAPRPDLLAQTSLPSQGLTPGSQALTQAVRGGGGLGGGLMDPNPGEQNMPCRWWVEVAGA